jgi:hypothetical protein
MKHKRFLITAIIFILVAVALTPSIAKAGVLVYDNNVQYLEELRRNCRKVI